MEIVPIDNMDLSKQSSVLQLLYPIKIKRNETLTTNFYGFNQGLVERDTESLFPYPGLINFKLYTVPTNKSPSIPSIRTLSMPD